MEKFLLKVNRVKVQTICLKTEKAKLHKENSQLKNYIKRYLTDLALKTGHDQRPISVQMHSEVKKIGGSSRKLYVIHCLLPFLKGFFSFFF